MEEYMFICILLCVFCCLLNGISCATVYKSCMDVKTANPASVDGEFPVYIQNKITVSIYCSGMSTNNPSEYLTLKSGKSNNFASFYDNVGSTSACADLHPRQIYNQHGRTEYNKIRLNVNTLEVDIRDTKFATSSGTHIIRYGTAGDQFAYSSKCTPMGVFKLDLGYTPFVVSGDIQWTWQGKFVTGTSQTGQAFITNTTYIGCFVDRDDRLLPSFSYSAPDMTSDVCIKHCNSKGFPFAGTQYYDQCYCGDSHNRHGRAPEKECNTPCRGNHNEMCGGTWRNSVYSTGIGQALEGRCGGYPGTCFPALKSAPTVPKLILQLIRTQPCLQPISPCANEGMCIALGADGYKCLCYMGFTGHNCDIQNETVIFGASGCPAGSQGEKCTCKKANCAGARFNGDVCETSQGSPQITCRTSDPSHVILINVNGRQGQQSISCPTGADLVSCTYWDASGHKISNGEADRISKTSGQCGLLHPCQQCTLQARCKKYDCGCQNQGHCHKITGECSCLDGYYGDKCQFFDYCSFYESHMNTTACGAGGVCSSIPQDKVRAYGGDQRGDYCMFPFTAGNTSYGRCVDDNTLGPPFACGAVFDGSRNGYIDLGPWSPGPMYTIAAWVRPAAADGVRRTIVGGVASCADFGLYNFENFWMYYKGKNLSCTKGIDTHLPIKVGKWYLVAVVSNGTHITGYANGQSNAIEMKPYSLPTTMGFWIGGEECCPTGRFKGMIKSIKIWKRPLFYKEIKISMNTPGNTFSTTEALTGGLVGHYEFGEVIKPPCIGLDHGGAEWVLTDGKMISGTHCNLTLFHIPKDVTVNVAKYDKNTKVGGVLQIEARNILIEGMLDATGAGYQGGQPTIGAGDSGSQGDSINGAGKKSVVGNKGAGGGGGGGNQRSDGAGQPGGGGGFGTAGSQGVKLRGDPSGLGQGGQTYGDGTMSYQYMGSGGGSGGRAKDTTTNPPGGRGGNGGGAIRLSAELNVQITSTGLVSVNGENGQGDSVVNSRCVGSCPKECSHHSDINCYGNSTTACWDNSGPGGGGSGGSIHIIGKVVSLGSNVLWAIGGVGGFGTKQGCGGAGGLGRIRVEAEILKGTSSRSSGVVTYLQRKKTFVDHSLPGRTKINLRSTRYGDEVYRGCFMDSASSRLLSQKIDTTSSGPNMSPSWCIQHCRRQGYKFSGTEYSNECYCDNHLDMSKKRSDGECNMKCAGNSMMTCGGNGRIQVFGPPPGTPAMSHSGVVEKCEPWCQTADLYSSNPKWGQCDERDAVSTSYKILCQCPPGFQGLHCSQPCDDWFFGHDCIMNCTCNQTNTDVCNSITGRCQCKPGFYGDQCQFSCPVGKYGTYCEGTCNCTGNTQCDPVSGACLCNDGFYGESCKFLCPGGFYGRNCSQTCTCSTHGSCDPVSGSCSCEPGYTNQFCGEKCDKYTFGVDCKFSCKCNGSPCHPVTGLCQCMPGKSGMRCEKPCPYQFYGAGCGVHCGCPESCDPVNGICTCPPGSFGQHCEFQCLNGAYGKNCQSRCQCYQNQTDTCDVGYGTCNCKPGFVGNNCQYTCSVGFYGANCNKTCPPCQHSAPCHPETGKCICPPGWTGDFCQTPCQPGFFGKNCAQTCSTCNPGVCSPATGLCICQHQNTACNCPSGYYGNKCQSTCHCVHGKCSSSGSCVCDLGWKGSTCATPCQDGDADCQPACLHCVFGTCHYDTKLCMCSPGYDGPGCDQTCVAKKYGPGCTHTCDYCLHSSRCDSKTGACICDVGYTGTFCDRPCKDGTYGQGCQQTCNCQNQGICNNVNGTCTCKDGYSGSDCSQKCPFGTFGLGCTRKCNCGIHSSGCDPVSGICQCQPGFYGAVCEKSCERNAWGQDCARACSDVCDMRGTTICSPIDGSCQCRGGYTGKKCDQSCPVGRWGVGCAQTCQCGSHGNCDRVTGTCDCDAGWNGTRCDQDCSKTLFWGKRCSNPCNCHGAGCNPVTGQCLCPPGKMGHHCEQECGSSHFGLQCAQLCGCKNNGACDKVTGICKCQPGWSGIFCDENCPDGTYGANCAQQCGFCGNGGLCDSITGQCLCPSGFMGDLCNTTCGRGTWGANCKSSCPAACSQSCLPQTGECQCHPGSCKNGGVCTKGVCLCPYGYYGDDCSQSLGGKSAAVSSQDDKSIVSLTSGQVAGIVIGIILLLILVVFLTFMLMRRRYFGQINSSNGDVMLQNDDSGLRGFENPHYNNEHNQSTQNESTETHKNNT